MPADSPNNAHAALVDQQHVPVVASVDPTGIDNVALLDFLGGLIEKVHEDGGRLVGDQALHYGVLLCPDLGLF